jgi:hypothetical protein
MRANLIAIIALAMVVIAPAAGAHHGTSTYDMNVEIELKGTVKEWTFGNPHSWLWLTIREPQKPAVEWSIESAPPNYLMQQGWSASTLKAGETLTVLISPLKNEPRRGILLEVKRSSGETLIVRPRGSFGRPASVKQVLISLTSLRNLI